MAISRELMSEYVASQGLTLFAQRKEIDKLKAEIEKLKAENKKLSGENLDYALKLRSAEGLMNFYKVSVERMREASARSKSSAYGVEIISTGEYKDGKVETIVWWSDGTITKVRLAKGEENDPYVAFTAALAKKVYGSNSAIHRIVNSDNNSHFIGL